EGLCRAAGEVGTASSNINQQDKSRGKHMDLDLTGKRALVTGSTRGIGLATATGLAQMGAEVIVNGREKAAGDAAREKIRQSPPSAKLHAAVLDLGAAEGCSRLIAQFP